MIEREPPCRPGEELQVSLAIALQVVVMRIAEDPDLRLAGHSGISVTKVRELAEECGRGDREWYQ